MNAKLIQYPGHPEWTELFDLGNDPYETKNLANDPNASDLKKKMLEEYDRQVKEVGFHVPEFADELLPADPARNAKPVMKPNKLVLDYRFDDVDQERIKDQTENKLDGKVQRVRVEKLSNGRTVGKFDGNAWIDVPKSKTLNPALSAFTIEAEVRPEADGIILARGGQTLGFCLYIRNGKPTFTYRTGEGATTLVAPESCLNEWTKISAQLTGGKDLVLRVDGTEKARKSIELLFSRDPNDGMQIGSDEGSSVLEKALGKFRGEMQRVQFVLGGKEG
jgi:hypothetical protein